MRSSLTGWHLASIPAPALPGIYQGWTPCVEWCRENLGDCADSGWYFRGDGIFEFRERDDYIMFSMVWGQ